MLPWIPAFAAMTNEKFHMNAFGFGASGVMAESQQTVFEEAAKR